MKKKYGVIAIIVAILVLGVGYAAISNINLNVTGSTATVSPDQANFVVKYDALNTFTYSGNPTGSTVTLTRTDDTTATFTVTGAASALLSSKKSKIRIISSTLGSVVDAGIKDAFNMGAVMAPAAAKTIYNHLINTKTKASDYDLILTGDLGRYGKDILKDYMEKEYGIELNNLDDSACMIYDIDSQDVYAGGSGPACIPLVTYGYILDKMKKGKLKKVLMVATGSLHSQVTVNLKKSIPAVSHAICLEANL